MPAERQRRCRPPPGDLPRGACGAAMRLVVTPRADSGFGAVEGRGPAAQFERDDEAARGAQQLARAVAPRFGGTGGGVVLPELDARTGDGPRPAAPRSASAAPASERWVGRPRDAAARLDDGITSAADVGRALHPRCTGLEAQRSAATLDEAGRARGIPGRDWRSGRRPSMPACRAGRRDEGVPEPRAQRRRAAGDPR
jgi:hypothetical protein